MDDLDPRKLYELSESFNELTGTVKYTSQAMQAMLGPQAEANKKLKESGNKRAKVEEQGAQQQAKQLSKQEESEAKQKKLFEDELRYRGYLLNKTGNLEKTTTELSASQKQSLETLDKRIAKERELAEVIKDPVKSFRNVAGSVNSLDGVMGQMQEKMFEMTGKSVPLAAGLIAATSVVAGVTKAALGMADALYKGERGAKVGAQAVKDLNDSVTKAAYGIGAALMFLPGLGIVAKVLGVAVAAFGLAMEGATKLTEMGAEYNDKVYKSFNELSEVGLTTSKGMSGVSTTMEKLGMTSAEIEKMNSLLASNSKDLALFGGTAAGGLEKFTEVAGKIANPASELNKKLMLLGISSDEQREHTLKYMANQTRMGMMQGKTQADLVKGATAYMEELDRIAAVTGIGRKEQEEAQKAVMSIENLRAAMFQAERSGDTKRQKELETAFKYSSRLMAEGRKKEAAGVAKYYAAGKNVVDAESAMAMQNSAGAIRAIGEGKTGEDVYQAGIESAKESAIRTAGTKRIGGDVSNQIGDFNATLDAIKRSEKVQAEAKKLGITPEAYAKKLQDEKKEKPDPSLAKNVEAMQIQQQAGLTIDQAAKAMDGAGLAMASSVKAFNEAVKLFGSASGVTSGEQQKQSEATGSHGIGGVGAEAAAIANVNAELDDKQREILNKAQKEYREAVKDGTTMQKYFGLNLDKKMQEAKNRLKLAEAGKLSEKELGGKSSSAPAQASTPASSPTPSPGGTSPSEGHSEGGEEKSSAAPTAPTSAPPVPLKSSSTKSDLLIANEPVTADRPLSNAQMAVIGLSLGSGNSYPAHVMEKYNSQKASKASPVSPASSDAIPINKANGGGIFEGPGSNSVMPNGNTMAANDILTSLRDSFGSVQKKSIESEVPKLTKFNTMTPSSRSGPTSSSMDILEKFTDIMEQKMSDVIDAISDNNSIKEEILLYSKA